MRASAVLPEWKITFPLTERNTVEFCGTAEYEWSTSVILYNRVFGTELTAAVESLCNWKSYRVVYENFLEKGVNV